MNHKPTPHIFHISSPDGSKVGSVIVIELAEHDEAIRVAQKFAQTTGRRVTVRDENLILMETIPAAAVH